jgi:DNA-binding NarL/FixJ family response regulator
MDKDVAPKLFQVLVIEDDDFLRHELCRRITEKFPGTQTIEVGDVTHAISVLQDGHLSSGKPDVIVSDLRLPLNAGDDDHEIHPDLIKMLLRARGRVILISEYVNEPDVKAIVENTEAAADNLISKDDDLEDNLLKRIRRILVGIASERIIYRFQRIYSPDAFPSEGAEEMGSVSPMSHVLRSEQEAIDYWPYLNDEAQDLVQRYYTIVRMDDGTVGLRPLGLGGGGSR